MKRWIGIGMYAAPFVILGFILGFKMGAVLTLLAFGIVAAIAIWVWVAVRLMFPILLLLAVPAWAAPA